MAFQSKPTISDLNDTSLANDKFLAGPKRYVSRHQTVSVKGIRGPQTSLALKRVAGNFLVRPSGLEPGT